MVTEAAMQQVKEPHARLPRGEERGAGEGGQGQRAPPTARASRSAQGPPTPHMCWKTVSSDPCNAHVTEVIGGGEKRGHATPGAHAGEGSPDTRLLLVLRLGG